MRRINFFVLSLMPLTAFAETEPTTNTPELVPGNVSAPTQNAAAGWTNFIFIAAIILLWLFVFRPQSKRVKEQRAFIASLKPDMEVYTSGGIIGAVKEVKENTVVLNVGTSNIKVLKSSIAGKWDQVV